MTHMHRSKRKNWSDTPAYRWSMVILGWALIVAVPLVSWLPGPGFQSNIPNMPAGQIGHCGAKRSKAARPFPTSKGIFCTCSVATTLT
jgi:hypothetical protein